MPTRSGKSYGSKVRYIKRKSRKSNATKALTEVRKLKRIVGVERKYHVYSPAGASITGTGTVVTLNSISQGDTLSTRDGDRINLLRLYGRMLVYTSASSTGSTLVKLAIVKGNVDGVPTYANVFETGTGSSLNVLKPKVPNTPEWQVLWTKTYTITPVVASTNQMITIPVNLRLKGQTVFDAGATTFKKGGLFLLACTNQATYTPQLEAHLRVMFSG